MENNNLNEKEIKFNNFINKTIIMSSKRYFKKECNTYSKEKNIIDNTELSNLLDVFTYSNTSLFENVNSKLELNSALNKLSVIEQTVIFLLFQEDLTQEEASQILEICSKSVSRIKIRALNKLRKYLKGDM